MTHAIIALQGALVDALKADAELQALLGDAIFDAPPREAAPPYLAIARHDVVAHDGDLAPGYAHRLVLHLWHKDPSRRAVLEIAERVVAVALAGALTADGWRVTNRTHQRTDTVIDLDTGCARAALTLGFLTEPS